MMTEFWTRVCVVINFGEFFVSCIYNLLMNDYDKKGVLDRL